MHEYTAYVLDILLYLRRIYMSASKLVTTEILSLGGRIGTDTGCVLDVDE